VEDAVAIVLAAGVGDRLGSDVPKAFVPLADRPLLVRAVEAALASGGVSSAVVVAPAGWEERARALVGAFGVRTVVTGGATRQASVRAGLAATPSGCARIVCHDAARALAPVSLFDAVLEALDGWDGVIPGLPVADTVKRFRGEAVEATVPRSDLALAQTPQAFLAAALRDAHERAERDGAELTDDAAALERAGYRVRVVPGDPRNVKITTTEDLARAELIASELARG
jgi:2-C-methyl-D-erythritol 4-phosphate cytidylyltransferase